MQKDEEITVEGEEDEVRDRIRRAIKSKGMKLKQFCRESGMAYPSLRDYYGGLRRPGFDALCKLVTFTGVSSDWLLIGKGPMFPDQEPKIAEVEEALLSEIACEVERAYQRDQNNMAADTDSEDYAYSMLKKEQQKRLSLVRDQASISANAYNRLVTFREKELRDRNMAREVQSLYRLYDSIKKSLLKEKEKET